METALKVAIVGAGRMAREHILAFRDLPQVQIAGIHSRTRTRAEGLATEFAIPNVCDSIPELFEKTSAGLVVISVPEMLANPVSKVCFEFPWTVFMEKPPGLDLKDAEDIHSAAASRKRRVFVALNRRFYSSTQTVLEEISGSHKNRIIKVQDQQDLAEAKALGHPPEVVRQWMYANSIHVIDYLRFFGRGRVTAISQVLPWNPRKPGLTVMKIQFDSGDIGLYEGIWDGPGPWAVTIQTPDKRWEMRPLEQLSCQLRGERKLQPIPLHPWDQQFKPGFRLQAKHAVDATLGKPTQSPTLEQSLETMRLIHAMFGQ